MCERRSDVSFARPVVPRGLLGLPALSAIRLQLYDIETNMALSYTLLHTFDWWD